MVANVDRGAAREAVLARRVAEAADAWLKDPADSGVYQRLVAAVMDWRRWVLPTLEAAAAEPVDEGYDESRDPRPVGESVRAVVEGLAARPRD